MEKHPVSAHAIDAMDGVASAQIPQKRSALRHELARKVNNEAHVWLLFATAKAEELVACHVGDVHPRKPPFIRSPASFVDVHPAYLSPRFQFRALPADEQCGTRPAMSKTRDNHFVPQWYQRGFIEPGRSKLALLDMKPAVHRDGNGRAVAGRSLFESPTTRCFHKLDLYTTEFGFEVNDEIERRLFGEIDRKGKLAVSAFGGADVEARMAAFQDFFEFMDAQKLRTPKGLEWLRRHYPFLHQNDLMFEMQGVRRMHCMLWATAVREVVSAEDSDAKFIISDHPVTVYNHAAPPGDPACAHPNDPQIAWKASQTIYPLDRNFCLILTNLEYAQDPDLPDPRGKRINAKNFGDALVRTDTLIRTRRLDARQVAQINHVFKARATRHVAAGCREWLFPEQSIDTDWAGIRGTLLPPKDELWHWGGETYVGFDNGHTAYQDAYGRSEPRSDNLLKPTDDHPRSPKDPCGCGSGKAFRACCATRPAELRPSWSELGIRERNIMHMNAIAEIIGMPDGKDWVQARRELTSEKIERIYGVFRVLWPPETDIFSLLPKPDGRLRALFTGMVDPRMVIEFANGSTNYFGEVLMQNPFLHAAGMKEEHDPTRVPGEYRYEVLKNILLLLDLMPLVSAGAVNLFPDPCHFDPHLRWQVARLAESRTEDALGDVELDERTRWLHRDDHCRAHWGKSDTGLRGDLRRANPEADDDLVDRMVAMVREGRASDPLACLTDNLRSDGTREAYGNWYHLVPNFELAMVIAQATGSVIVTDSPFRWREITMHARWKPQGPIHALPQFRAAIVGAEHGFLEESAAIAAVARSGAGAGYQAMIADALRYLAAVDKTGPKPNWESQLPSRFAREHRRLQEAMRRTGTPVHAARVNCIIPTLGIRDNSINRILVTSSVDHYLDRVPMAFFFEPPDPSRYDRELTSRPWRSSARQVAAESEA